MTEIEERCKMAIPDFFIEMLKKQYGEEIAATIINGYGVNRKTTFRINRLKTTLEEVTAVMKEKGIAFSRVEYYEDAFILDVQNEKCVEELDIYKEGKIYMQSLSSMLPPLILEPAAKQDILDMAAAPGGKTSQMAAMTDNKAFITACELNTIRAERLKYNMNKQGAACVNVMTKDARTIDDFFKFDKILLDAPCSGSGVLDIEDEKLAATFTKKLIDKSVKSQSALLKKAATVLKKNCDMVYSTCSVLEEENEAIIKKLISEGTFKVIPIDTEIFKGMPLLPVKIPGTLCVAPNELYEGFYVAHLKKVK